MGCDFVSTTLNYKQIILIEKIKFIVLINDLIKVSRWCNSQHAYPLYNTTQQKYDINIEKYT